MKTKALFFLTISLLLISAAPLWAAQQVKVVTYYASPDTEYMELTVNRSAVLAKDADAKVVIGSEGSSSSPSNLKLDVSGDIILDGDLTVGEGLQLAKNSFSPSSSTPDGLVWIES